MIKVLAFDVYGTLINTQGVVDDLYEYLGDQAHAFARTWRDKQLEYSFRRGLMNCYEPFSVCIAQSFDYCCSVYNLKVTPEQQTAILELYLKLPVFVDVKPTLSELIASEYKIYAFSNGSPDAVNTILENAGIREYFIDIVSVNDVNTFKPNPEVYKHFMTKTSSRDNAYLISSNPFDVIGAVHAGMQAVWVKRSDEQIFDPWGKSPDYTIHSLTDLVVVLA